jgi:hypothetical protein
MNVCCHVDKKIMYWFKIKLEKTEGVIKNGQSRRHRQHWVQEWTIQETSATLGTRMDNPGDIGNIALTKTQDENKQSKKQNK